MGEFKIEKGVPIPNDRRRAASGVCAIIRELEVGDSFYIPCGEKEKLSVAGSARAQFYRLGVPMTQRSEGGGVRFWRVS